MTGSASCAHDAPDMSRNERYELLLMAKHPDIVERVIAESSDMSPPSRRKVIATIKDETGRRRSQSVTDAPVMAFGRTSNAELMVDCELLGYLADPVLDATYGLGAFWRCPRARAVTAVDLDPRRGVLVADFRSLPFADVEFATVVLDPPYKLNGTGGSHPSDDRYGVATAGVSWQDKHELIRDGMTDCTRVLRPGGHLLVKCQDQVCSGSVRWQTREFADHAETLGLRLVDMLHVVGHRRQPSGRRQVHARRNYSTLLVFRRPRGAS